MVLPQIVLELGVSVSYMLHNKICDYNVQGVLLQIEFLVGLNCTSSSTVYSNVGN